MDNDARRLGFRAEKVAEIASQMGLDVAAVVMSMERDYVAWVIERSFD